MIGSRRAGRILAPLLLGLLATWDVDGRAMADDPAASLSTSFRRAAARARGSLVSVRIPDGFLSPGPALRRRPGRLALPLMAPFVNRQTEGDGPHGLLGRGHRCRQGSDPHRRSGDPGCVPARRDLPRRSGTTDHPDPTRPPQRVGRPRRGHAGPAPHRGELGQSRQAGAGGLADRAGAARRRRPLDVGGRLQHPASGRRRGTARDRRGDHPGRRRRDPDQPERRGRRDLQARGPARGRIRGDGTRHPRRSGASGGG